MFDHVQAFYCPTTVPAALRLLRTLGPGSRVVAGGTDLAVQAQRSTRYLIDITRLGLDYIRRKPKGWAIGATTTMAALELSPEIAKLADGILAQAASTCGSVQLRNMATVGGNLANASPAADTATPLLALDASAVVQTARGKNAVPLSSFFTGPHRTALQRALLVEIRIPDPPRGSRWCFQKLGRTESDIAVVNLAAGLRFDRSGQCSFASLALGAVAPTPMRAQAAEALLIGQKLTSRLLGRVAAQVMQDVQPISDIRGSAEYRREMCGVLVKRALADCAERAGCVL